MSKVSNAERTANLCTALACATVTVMWALALSAPAHAETIKPTCSEDNVNGEVHRHCEVNRPPKPGTPPRLRNDAGAPPAPGPHADRPQAPPPRHIPFSGRYVGPESVPPYSPAFGPAEGAPYYRSPQLYDFAGPAPVYAQSASPYQPCVTFSDDGFVEVKDGPNEWAFNIQVLPNGVPLLAATYGYQVPYVWGGEVWVFVQTGPLQGWSRLASLSCQ